MANTGKVAERLVADLMSELDLTREQALGLVGNLAHESAGFKKLQEVGGGGFGYAQWTGPRRREFEGYAKSQGLEPSSYEANKGFIVRELKGKERAALQRIKGAQTADQAATVAMKAYFRPGVPHLDRRIDYTNQFAASVPNSALAAINAVSPMLPARRPDSVANPTGGLTSRTVQSVPVNPMTGTAVSFPALRSAAMQRDIAGPTRYETADRAIGTMSALVPTPNTRAAAPTKSAVPALPRSTYQIGQEADNARLSGYRQIQEMGPSSKGAIPTTPAVRPPTARPVVSSVPYNGKAPSNFTGSDPFDAYIKDYAATIRPPAAPGLPNTAPSSGTTYFPQSPGVEYGYNFLTGNYEVKKAGQPYTSVQAPAKMPGKGGGVLSPAGYPPNSTTDKRYDQRLAPQLPTIAGAYGKLGASGSGSGSLTASMPKASASSEVVNIAFEPMSEVSGMNIANSTGKPVRTPSGKVYQPTNAATDRVRAPMQQVANQPAQQQRQPGLMGLFSGLFGGQQGGGGLFGGGGGPGLFGGGGSSAPAPQPTYTTTQFQQDNFQTTAGAQMPSSMNNSRWTTGY